MLNSSARIGSSVSAAKAADGRLSPKEHKIHTCLSLPLTRQRRGISRFISLLADTALSRSARRTRLRWCESAS